MGTHLTGRIHAHYFTICGVTIDFFFGGGDRILKQHPSSLRLHRQDLDVTPVSRNVVSVMSHAETNPLAGHWVHGVARYAGLQRAADSMTPEQSVRLSPLNDGQNGADCGLGTKNITAWESKTAIGR